MEIYSNSIDLLMAIYIKLQLRCYSSPSENHMNRLYNVIYLVPLRRVESEIARKKSIEDGLRSDHGQDVMSGRGDLKRLDEALKRGSVPKLSAPSGAQSISHDILTRSSHHWYICVEAGVN